MIAAFAAFFQAPDAAPRIRWKPSAARTDSACADRDGNGITLYVRGRDVEEKESALKFVGGMRIVPEAAVVRRSSERGNILAVLEEAIEPMASNVIADVTGMKGGNVRWLFHSMQKAGKLQKTGRGQYVRSGWASE